MQVGVKWQDLVFGHKRSGNKIAYDYADVPFEIFLALIVK